jgi:hypothetical protein
MLQQNMKYGPAARKIHNTATETEKPLHEAENDS